MGEAPSIESYILLYLGMAYASTRRSNWGKQNNTDAGRRRGRVPLQRLSDKNIKAEPRTVHTVRGSALLTLARHTRQPPGFKSY